MWYILIGFGVFLFMEFVAWFTHKYIMHGFLWVLHKDHHSPVRKRLEKNDWFSFIFAIPSITGIIVGIEIQSGYILAIGFGILAYGIAYFLFHDAIYHQRVRLKRPHQKYFQAIIRAHDDHHRGKKNYGFLFMVPIHYFR